MDTAKVIMVDLTTFEELSAVIDQLLYFVGELSERDANAGSKLSAIVKRLSDIFAAITEGNVPEVGPIFDAINDPSKLRVQSNHARCARIGLREMGVDQSCYAGVALCLQPLATTDQRAVLFRPLT